MGVCAACFGSNNSRNNVVVLGFGSPRCYDEEARKDLMYKLLDRNCASVVSVWSKETFRIVTEDLVTQLPPLAVGCARHPVRSGTSGILHSLSENYEPGVIPLDATDMVIQ